MYAGKQNKISHTSAEEDESPEDNRENAPRPFLKKGGGRLGVGRGVSNSSISSAQNQYEPEKKPGYSAMSSRSLHFRPSPPGSPSQGTGRDSLNGSADDGGEFQDFERHIKQVHTNFLRTGPNSRAPSSPPRTHAASSASNRDAAPKSPAVDFSPVMQALEVKLARMTQENITMKSEREALMHSFREQIDDLVSKHERELVDARRHREDEIKKLKDNYRILERRQVALDKHTVMKKERAEIEELQQTISKLRTDHTARESTWRMTMDKVKASNIQLMEKNEALEKKIAELSVEIHRLSEGEWVRQKTLLQNQVDLLLTRNTELENLLSDEREVNAALSKLKTELHRAAEPAGGMSHNGSMSLTDIAHRRSLSPTRTAAVGHALPSTSSITPSVSHQPASSHSNPHPRYSPPIASTSPRQTHSSIGYEQTTEEHTPWRATNSPTSIRQAWTEPRPGVHAGASQVGVVSERKLDNGAVQQLHVDGSKSIIFKNGTTKEQTSDGKQIVRFANGDVKEVTLDGTITYFYKDARTTHITYPGGLQLIHFPDNHMEKHFPDGTKEIVFPNKVRKKLYPDGREQILS